MGQKDIAEKVLESYDDVFADIVNVLVYHGEQQVLPEDLVDTGERSAYKADGKYRELERDVAKYWMDQDIHIACIGFENQSQPDPDMPIRVMGYDAAEYNLQVKKGSAARYPVVSLVLYMGYEKRWNQPLSLHDMMRIPMAFRDIVNNYRINLYEIAWLDRATIDMFRSDFWIVADYLWQRRANHDYKPTHTQFVHVQETLSMLSVMTGDRRFEEAANMSEDEEVPRTMDDFWDRVENKAFEKGITAGKIEAVRNLMESLHLSAEQAMDALKIPSSERNNMMTML